VGGAGGGVGGIEIRFQDYRFILEGVNIQQVDSLARPLGSIACFYQAYFWHHN
jgi:hypothetical protein